MPDVHLLRSEVSRHDVSGGDSVFFEEFEGDYVQGLDMGACQVNAGRHAFLMRLQPAGRA